MSDELKIGIDKGIENDINSLVKAFKLLNREILTFSKSDLDNLQSTFKNGNVKDALDQFKKMNAEVKQMEQFLSQGAAKKMRQTKSIRDLQNNYNLHTKALTPQELNQAARFPPNEIRQLTKAMGESMTTALNTNNKALAKKLNEQELALNKAAKRQEQRLLMSPTERQAKRARDHRDIQKTNLESARMLRADNAFNNRSHSVVDKKKPYVKQTLEGRKESRESQKLLISMLSQGTDKKLYESAKRSFTYMETQEKAFAEKQRIALKQKEASLKQQQRLADKDPSGSGRQSTIFDLNNRVRENYKVTSKDAAGLNDLKKQISYREKLLRLYKEEAQLKGQNGSKDIKRNENILRGLQRQQDQLKSDISYQRAITRGLDQGKNKSTGAISRMQGRERMWGDGGASMFKTQAGLLGNYAVMGAGIGTASNAVGFTLQLDKALRQLQAILALTNGELEGLTTHLIEVSEKTKFTALEVVEASTVMGQSGFSPETIREAITSTTYLATAIGADLKTAVDLQTSMMGVYNKTAPQMMDVSDKIVTAINTSKLNLEKLTLGVQYSGNISSQLGVSMEENMAGLAAMANSGIRSGSTLGTGMRQVLTAMQKPSSKFLSWLDDVGLKMSDIDVKSHGLYKVLVTLQEAGFDMQQASKMWETRAATALGAIMNNLGMFNDMMLEFDQAQGAALAANDKQMLATLNQWDRIKSIMGTVASDGLEPMRVVLTELLRQIADFLTGIKEIGAVTSTVMSAITGSALAVGGFQIFKLIKNLIVDSDIDRARGRLNSPIGPMTQKRKAAADKFNLENTANLGIIAQSLKTIISGAGKAGVIGAVGGVGVAAVGAYMSSIESNADVLDKHTTELETNVAEYKVQQNAISDVNKTLVDLQVKQHAYGEDTQALQRYTANLENKFGDLGFVLGDMGSSIEGTKAALIEFRDTLIEMSDLPTKSYGQVNRAQQALLHEIRNDPVETAKLLGQESVISQNGTNVNLMSSPGLANRRNVLNQNPEFKEAIVEGLKLLTPQESGYTPLQSKDLTDKSVVDELRRDITLAMQAIKVLTARGAFENPNKPNETVPSATNAYENLAKVNTQLFAIAKNLSNEEKNYDKEAFAKFITAFEDKNSHKPVDLQTQMRTVLDQYPEINSNDGDPYRRADLIQKYLLPLQDAAVALQLQTKMALKKQDAEYGTDYSQRLGQISSYNVINELLSSLAPFSKVMKDILTEKSKYSGAQQLKATKSTITQTLKELKNSTNNDEVDKLLKSLEIMRGYVVDEELQKSGLTPKSGQYIILNNRLTQELLDKLKSDEIDGQNQKNTNDLRELLAKNRQIKVDAGLDLKVDSVQLAEALKSLSSAQTTRALDLAITAFREATKAYNQQEKIIGVKKVGDNGGDQDDARSDYDKIAKSRNARAEMIIADKQRNLNKRLTAAEERNQLALLNLAYKSASRSVTAAMSDLRSAVTDSEIDAAAKALWVATFGQLEAERDKQLKKFVKGTKRYNQAVKFLDEMASDSKRVTTNLIDLKRSKAEEAKIRYEEQQLKNVLRVESMAKKSSVSTIKSEMSYNTDLVRHDELADALVKAIEAANKQKEDLFIQQFKPVGQSLEKITKHFKERNDNLITKSIVESASKRQDIVDGVARDERKYGKSLFHMDVKNVGLDYSNIVTQLKAKNTLSSDIALLEDALIESVKTLITEKADEIRASEPNKTRLNNKLDLLDKELELRIEKARLVISAAKQRRFDRALSGDKAATQSWKSEMNSDWTVFSRYLAEEKKNRSTVATETKESSNAKFKPQDDSQIVADLKDNAFERGLIKQQLMDIATQRTNYRQSIGSGGTVDPVLMQGYDNQINAIKEQLSNNLNKKDNLTKSDLAKEGLTELKKMLNSVGLDGAQYTQLADAINEKLEEVAAYQLEQNAKQINMVKADQALLDNKRAQYATQLAPDSGLSDDMRQTVEKLLASANDKNAGLILELQRLSLESQRIREQLSLEQSDTNTTEADQTFFKGRYKSQEYRNTSSFINGTPSYDEEGNEGPSRSPDIASMEGFAALWEKVKNASTLYGREIDRLYGGMDPLQEIMSGMVDLTGEAIEKTGSLFAEWVMGSKSAGAAFEDLAKMVIQMLIQIAIKIAVLSALDALGLGAATGGKMVGDGVSTKPNDGTQLAATGGRMLRRSEGGRIPSMDNKVSQAQDTVPVMTMPGEWVIRSSVARDWGDGMMSAVNNGQIKPSDMKPSKPPQEAQAPKRDVNVWLVQKPEDAGNGGIGANDVVAIVEDNIMRKGTLRTLLKRVAID